MLSDLSLLWLSSVDMKEERNWLLHEGMPKLQQLAQETDVMIQIVDLFWGACEDMAFDHELHSIHLEQINYSRQYSAGPFFAVRCLSLIGMAKMRNRAIFDALVITLLALVTVP